MVLGLYLLSTLDPREQPGGDLRVHVRARPRPRDGHAGARAGRPERRRLRRPRRRDLGCDAVSLDRRLARHGDARRDLLQPPAAANSRACSRAGAARRPAAAASVNPRQIAQLPPELHAGYLHAFTSSLSSVFLVAALVGVVAFALSWFISELPLRETVTTGDLGDTYATPRDSASLAKLVNMIGRLERREGARDIIVRIAARAGVELSPGACWLLARLSREEHPRDLATLAAHADIPISVLNGACDRLLEQALIEARGEQHFHLTERGQLTLEQLRATGEQRLSDLLHEWQPQDDPNLASLIRALADDFMIDSAALEPLPGPPAAVARGG